jgi:NTP pyrophosphatase (non-canonical NTP hydrolase)
VTLLTDIVRCAVQFETPADLLRFVKEWVFLYGEPQTRDPPRSMVSRLVEELKEFMHVVTNSSIPECHSPNNQSDLPSELSGKIFEILRIRNRLDPELEEVPGGYRDFAIKINIGFHRQVLSRTANLSMTFFWLL